MHLTTLANKLRVVTIPSEATQAVTVMIMVGAGSRYETKDINGISHFLEHMFFKGGEKYPNAKAVAEAIDCIGGEFNAFTGKEYAGYYVKVAHEQIETAFSVLADMMLQAKFPSEEIEKERGVILEEYNMYQDTPMYKIGWQFEEQLFGNQPIGWDQIGEPDLIKTVTQAQFQEYKDQLYTPDNIVIGIAGNTTQKEAERLVEQYFPMETTQKAYNFTAFSAPESTDQLIHTVKKTEQSHVVVGMPGVAQQDQYEWPCKILATILGGNMSSRMFLNIREAHGLAYYIRTGVDTYSDTGILSTSAGVDNQRLPMAIEAILNEYYNVLDSDPITAAELEKAKNYLKGKLILQLEDLQVHIHMATRQELLQNQIDDIDELLHKIEAVTLTDVQAIATQLIKPETMHVSIIGPNNDKQTETIQKLISQR